MMLEGDPAAPLGRRRPRESRIVFIGRNLDTDRLRAGLRGLRGTDQLTGREQCRVVVTDIARADRAAADALAGYGVATVHEAQGRAGLMAPRMRPIWRGRADQRHRRYRAGAAGRQLDDPRRRRAMPGGRHHGGRARLGLGLGLFRRLLGTLLQSRGVRGLVLDAGCRDVDDLEKMGFPVWSRCISAHGTVKETLGDVNIPSPAAIRLVNPGDVIVADNDGVVVVPRLRRRRGGREIERARGARGRHRASATPAGELGLDFNNMRPKLAEKGLTYVARPT